MRRDTRHFCCRAQLLLLVDLDKANDAQPALCIQVRHLSRGRWQRISDVAGVQRVNTSLAAHHGSLEARQQEEHQYAVSTSQQGTKQEPMQIHC